MEPLLTDFLGDAPADADAALAENPHSCDAWNTKGCQEFAEGNFSAALTAFGHAVSLSDQYHHYIHYECAASFLRRACWHMQVDDWCAAKVDLDAAIFQDHGALSALSLRAWIAERIDNDEALVGKLNAQAVKYAGAENNGADWREAPEYKNHLASDSAWRKAIILVGFPAVEYPASQHDAALKILKKSPEEAVLMLRDELHHPRAWRHYAMALEYAGERDAAKKAYDEAVERHLEWHNDYHRAAASHRLNRALTHERLGDAIMAWQEASKAADIDKKWEIALSERVRLSELACA